MAIFDGWRNYETQRFFKHLEEDTALRDLTLEAAQRMLSEAGSRAMSDRSVAMALGSQLREYVEAKRLPLSFGFYDDLLTAAIADIDFREIAMRIIDDVGDKK